MVCPLYVDFTRNCIEKFPDFLVFPTFDLCQSDDYKGCLAYLILNSSFSCPYLITCGKEYKKNLPKVVTRLLGEKETRDIYYKYAVQYCTSQENHVNCAKYKLLSAGKIPPITLFPDGRKVNPLEFLVKRKIL
jgi:hypothetical protein